MCESIGHRPLRGRCPKRIVLWGIIGYLHLRGRCPVTIKNKKQNLKRATGTADHVTLLRLLSIFYVHLYQSYQINHLSTLSRMVAIQVSTCSALVLDVFFVLIRIHEKQMITSPLLGKRNFTSAPSIPSICTCLLCYAC